MYYLETHTLTKDERSKYEQMGLFCYDLRGDDDSCDIATIEEGFVQVNNVGSMLTSEKIPCSPAGFINYETFVNSDENDSSVDIYELLDSKLQAESNANIAKCEQGVCPFCHQETLDFGAAEFIDNNMVYPWKCTTCNHEGEEWYELNFIGHNADALAGEIILKGGE